MSPSYVRTYKDRSFKDAAAMTLYDAFDAELFTKPYTPGPFILSRTMKLTARKTYISRNIPLCLKSKCTDFLFNYLLDLPEITSYLLRRYTAVPTFLPLIIAALEVIFRKCV